MEACAGSEADERVAEYAIYARDHEFARTAEDVLFRRLRVGQLNEKRARELLPRVAAALEGREYVPPVEDVREETPVVGKTGVSVESAAAEPMEIPKTEDVAKAEVDDVVSADEVVVEKKAKAEDIIPVEAAKSGVDTSGITDTASDKKIEIKTEAATEAKVEMTDDAEDKKRD